MKAFLVLTWLSIAGAGYYGYNFYQKSLADAQESTQALDAAHTDVTALTAQVALLKDQMSTLRARLAAEKRASDELPLAAVVSSVPVASPEPQQTSAPIASTVTKQMPASIPATITTLAGKTYTGCVLSRITPDGISFTHSMGVAKVLFSELDPIFAATFGYDPVAAKKYEQDQALLASQSDAHRAAAEGRVASSADNSVGQAVDAPATPQVPPAQELSDEQRDAIQKQILALESDIAFMKREESKAYYDTGHGGYSDKIREEEMQLENLQRKLQ